MAGNIFDAEPIFSAWVASEPNEDLHLPVLEKLAWISSNLDEVHGWPAMPAEHPMKRVIEVDEGVLITVVVMKGPIRSARLLKIETLTDEIPDCLPDDW